MCIRLGLGLGHNGLGSKLPLRDYLALQILNNLATKLLDTFNIVTDETDMDALVEVWVC